MTNQIKNFIEEKIQLKQEFNEYISSLTQEEVQTLDELRVIVADWWLSKFSSRQISLIKMVVGEQQERFSNMLDEFFKGTDEVNTRKHILIGLLRGINNDLTDGK
jgi:uncharacterized ion transporter superfamily protein YfcC